MFFWIDLSFDIECNEDKADLIEYIVSLNPLIEPSLATAFKFYNEFTNMPISEKSSPSTVSINFSMSLKNVLFSIINHTPALFIYLLILL